MVRMVDTFDRGTYVTRGLRHVERLVALCGIARATRRSGNQCQVRCRSVCVKYPRQTFHEFADNAPKFCEWTKSRNRMLRDGGMKHRAAFRKFARSWLRILFRVWQTGEPFDCERYFANLRISCPARTNNCQEPEEPRFSKVVRAELFTTRAPSRVAN